VYGFDAKYIWDIWVFDGRMGNLRTKGVSLFCFVVPLRSR
jgi:hypothetical protein